MTGRRLLLCLTVLVALPLSLGVSAATTSLPDALERETRESLRILDRHGRLIQEVQRDGERSTFVKLGNIPPDLVNALIVAEDARFRRHFGIDLLSIGRAFGQLVWHRRVVSGASTLTQQLARTLIPRERNLAGKWREMALALRLEASLGKDRILEEYLNRVHFGPRARGVGAASELFFDKPVSRLSLAEAATLAAMPRGPSFYDPRRGVERVRARRDWILRRLEAHGYADERRVARALAEPLAVRPPLVEGGAPHLVRGLALSVRTHAVTTTLDLDLQKEVEGLAARAVDRLAEYDATAAAVIVVDSPTGEVLAYVGSPDFFSTSALGQNDGVRALRQPGSTLKPFLYARAIESHGYTAATLLPDVELRLPTSRGDYSPRNYDGRFHGPVRLREALASSLNVPAVFVAHRLGVDRVLQTLRDFGFSSLDRTASHYGPAIALGDGEVRLNELAAAYATLARGGVYRPMTAVLDAERVEERHVLDETTAALVTDILSDDTARLGAFGRGSALALPFPAAVKTGTSKGYRDNWTVGYTRAVTVAVWVGNFDGRPMRGSSGVTGAAPLFHDVMIAAQRRAVAAEAMVDRTRLVGAHVCTLSGERPGPHCPKVLRESFVAGTAPTDTCSMHVAAPRRGPRDGMPEVLERYPSRYLAWAIAARRPLAPAGASDDRPSGAAPEVAFPRDGAEFVVDATLPREQQVLVLSARVPAETSQVRFVLNDEVVGQAASPFSTRWALVPGRHRLHVETDRGVRGEGVEFVVH